MRIPAAAVAVAAVVVAAAAGAERAAACSPVVCDDDAFVRVPAHGAVDVPLDTLLWLTSFDPESIMLIEGNDLGSVVATERLGAIAVDSLSGPGGVFVLRPRQRLKPLTRYVLGSFDFHWTMFTTGTGDGDDVERAPPRVPVPRIVARVSQEQPDGCGFPPHVLVTVSVAHDGVVAVADLDNFAILDVVELNGRATALFTTPTVPFGTAGCAYRWPNAVPGSIGRARFGAFGVDGAFSGWSEWLVIDAAPAEVDRVPLPEPPPPDDSGGCASTPAPPLTFVLLVVLARRRRHPRSNSYCRSEVRTGLSRESDARTR